MKYDKPAIQYKDGQLFLFDSSYRTLNYAVVLATLLTLYLGVNNAPKKIIITWLIIMTILISIRRLHCKIVISKGLFNGTFHLRLFVVLAAITGLLWTSLYFLLIPYVGEGPQYVIILAFGGQVTGCTTTLGVYSTVYFIYIFSIFIPVIIFNYSFEDINHIILATMFSLYLLALTTVTKAHQTTLKKIFFLTEQNKELRDKFENLSITDALTGLYNRRHFTKIIQEEYNHVKRNKQAMVLISIDVDNFKSINDNFGHPFGDKFLMYTSGYLKNYLMPVDGMIFRLGGDEFAALAVNVTEEKIKEICYEIKNNFMRNPRFGYGIQDSNHQKILEKVSLSIGVVYIPHDSATNMEQMIDKADQLLYQAKNQGKNEIKYTKL